MNTPNSSVLSPIDFTQVSKLTESLLANYAENGIAYLEKFLDAETLSAVHRDLEVAERDANQELAEKWGGEKICFYSKNPVKSTDSKNVENFVNAAYFKASAHAAHVFFEEIDDRLVMNRMGHALHLKPEYPALERVLFGNDGLRTVMKALGYRHPICLLSVYIPKFPNGAGSEVKPHQESTFANTNPLSNCALWVALEDATIENACMWGLLGSHRLPLKYVSKVDHARNTREYEQIADVFIPEFKMTEEVYAPLEVKAGDALLFHGNFVHCSPRNTSDRSRKALTYQFVETDGVEFSRFNWIREPNSRVLY